ANDKKLQLKMIAELKQLFKKTSSITVRYYLYLVELKLFMNDEKYNECIKICAEIKKLIQKNICMYKENRLGFMYSNIARCQLFQSDFEQAIKNATKATTFFKNDS